MAIHNLKCLFLKNWMSIFPQKRMVSQVLFQFFGIELKPVAFCIMEEIRASFPNYSHANFRGQNYWTTIEIDFSSQF